MHESIRQLKVVDLPSCLLYTSSKTILQEIVQGQTEEPLTYELLKEEGPDHNKLFESRALIGGQDVYKRQTLSRY